MMTGSGVMKGKQAYQTMVLVKILILSLYWGSETQGWFYRPFEFWSVSPKIF